ncbi:MAG: Mth938-like domain-containing protein [Asgard group archaeon]|nr:Mth938-like domain-containing protein [Asgard group archaeon]
MNTIDDYSFGKIIINGKSYSSDLFIYPEKVITNWWREEGHSLCMKDLEALEKDQPAVLIIGTGAYGRMAVPKDVVTTIKEKGIEVIINKTGKAVKKFNELVKKGTKVVAALHLTC